MAQTDWLKPTLDIGASGKEYTISVELPGVDEKEVQLELLNDTLKIKGEKKQQKEEKEKNYYRMERSYGSFQLERNYFYNVHFQYMISLFTIWLQAITELEGVI